jgi:hypothetical protein
MHVRKSGKSVHFRLCHHLVEALVELNTAPAHNSGGLRNRVHEEDSALSQSVVARARLLRPKHRHEYSRWQSPTSFGDCPQWTELNSHPGTAMTEFLSSEISKSLSRVCDHITFRVDRSCRFSREGRIVLLQTQIIGNSMRMAWGPSKYRFLRSPGIVQEPIL